MIGFIAFGVILLHAVLTLDETMIVLVSCLPAIFVLGKLLKKAYRAGEKVITPVLMLSGTAIGLFLSPLDTIAPTISLVKRQWIEVGTGGGFGNYQKISRDCDGNIVNREFINYNSGALDINSNWQNGNLYLKSGIRGAFGTAKPRNSNFSSDYDDNYRYSSFGLYGKLSYNSIGVSLGIFNRQKIFYDGVKEVQILPSATLRLGPVKKYSFDIRIFDEPAFGFSSEPVFSMGLFNWGFKDPTGSKFLRFGFATTNSAEFSYTMSLGFPLGDDGWSGSLTGYVGNANLLNFGLRYRFKGIQK